ncbi:MAG: transcription elongation factor Spt5 [Candidatus Helarchaeota archaeon]|nr:transcription elongation factor Spt5 [Candidatus Helarchaeota archaeon]
MRGGAKPQIFAIKTTIGQEKAVIDFMMQGRMKDALKAILVPETLRGYIFVETHAPQIVNQELVKIPHVRGRLIGQVNIAELEEFLIAKKSTEGVEIGDIVEIIGGPFKGEKAKITRVDTTKDEVILELFESTHPIPIKVHADYIKKIMSAEELEPGGEVKKERRVEKKVEKEGFFEEKEESEGGEEELVGEGEEKEKKRTKFVL